MILASQALCFTNEHTQKTQTVCGLRLFKEFMITERQTRDRTKPGSVEQCIRAEVEKLFLRCFSGQSFRCWKCLPKRLELVSGRDWRITPKKHICGVFSRLKRFTNTVCPIHLIITKFNAFLHSVFLAFWVCLDCFCFRSLSVFPFSRSWVPAAVYTLSVVWVEFSHIFHSVYFLFPLSLSLSLSLSIAMKEGVNLEEENKTK